jgi:IS605 OrfB family transposase
MGMKLVATVKLIVDADQKTRLLATMARVNEACTWLAQRAFELKLADKIRLQRLYYHDLRNLFGLSAQHAVRAISKVCEAYKRDRTKLVKFAKHNAVPYDQRLYSFKNGLDRVSLLALDGRMVVPCAVGAYHRARLEGVRGQADLVYRKGKLYLFVTVEVPDGSPIDPEGWIGVDLGIRNLAVDSDGEAHSGEPTLAVRSRIAKLRVGLQSSGTKSAKRHLRKLRRREQRFHSHTNHVISKKIVRKAKDTVRGIAIEDLSGIRDRVTVRKAQRGILHSWSFFQLRSFLVYKATLSGVVLVAVDPRNTSRTCPECGCVDKANRKTQSKFVCTGCGFAANADHVGARNIASRADVIRPIAEVVRLGIEKHSSPQLCHLQSPLLAAAAAGG